MNAPARVAFLLFAVAWGTNHFVPLLPAYRRALSLDETDLAQVFGIYAVGLVPGLLAGGPISDRIGRRRLVVPAALVALVGSFILGLGPSRFTTLLLGRFVVGLGSGATFSAATAWVQDLAVPNGAGASGAGARRAATALSAGFGGGPLVASLIAQWLPWPLLLPYGVQIAVLALAIAGVALLPPARARQTVAGARAPSRFVPAGFVAEVVPVAPWVFGLPSISFAVLPALVRGQLGRHGVVFTGVVTATTLFAGLLVQGPLRARSATFAGRAGVACGLAGILLGILAVRAGAPLGVVLAAAVLGAGYGGCLVSGLRFVESHSPPDARGRVTGVFYLLAYLGFAAPLGLAASTRLLGPTGALLLAAGLAAFSLLLQLRIKPVGGLRAAR